ncbi:MAG TPA: hypothetical protein VGO61_12795 [Steroidobacteraceae bacterium]|nr:hypothetical protein [Steroidobacteraceae bacterium]
MRSRPCLVLLISVCWQPPTWAQCAPAPDSAYFFRNLAELRAEAKLAEDRSFYEGLLSEHFVTKDREGKALPKRAFIAKELAADHAATRYYAVRNFRLVEHRKGLAVANYLLVEGDTESWRREVYEVEGGKWRLAAIEAGTPESELQAQSASVDAR